MLKKKESDSIPNWIEVNPMTEKEYIEWYIETYGVDPPVRFLKTCIDNYTKAALEEDPPCDDEEWLKELLGDDTEDWLG